MRLPTGSALDRCAVCPASEAYPHAKSINPWASRGTVIHEYLARVPELGEEEALAEVPAEHRDACAAIPLERLPVGGLAKARAEVSYAFDTLTGSARVIGVGEGRQYAQVEPHEIPGTADVEVLADDGETVIIYDYKTGYGHVPAVADNWQLRFYALCAARAHSRQRAVVVVVRVVDGDVWMDRATLDELDLDVFETQLDEVMARVRETRELKAPKVTTGDHCRYCPAFSNCPEQRARVGAIVAQEPATEITVETAANAWTALKHARQYLDNIENAIKAFAAMESVDLPNGKVLGLADRTTESLDGQVAFHVLKELADADLAMDAVQVKVTKDAIKAVARELKARDSRSMKFHEETILEAIRQRGGTRTKTTTAVREYHPTKAEAVNV